MSGLLEYLKSAIDNAPENGFDMSPHEAQNLVDWIDDLRAQLTAVATELDELRKIKAAAEAWPNWDETGNFAEDPGATSASLAILAGRGPNLKGEIK
jgi:hypothetical protein